MESWNCDSGDKGFLLSNDAVSALDFPNPKTKAALMGWELKDSSYDYEDHIMLVPSQQQPFENQGVLEVGFPDLKMKRTQSSQESVNNGLSNFGSGRGDVVINTNQITSNTISCDKSSSRLSNSVVDSNSKESSLIDLKLGRLSDNLKYNATSRTSPILSSAESSVPAKRIKASSLNCQPGFCQVHGCNKDLSSSKDYHKRHKVCEVHSKTAKVVVNGIDQRFCQQCSRFHLLAEFDDVKRSCRKRLAVHNERRRKPQVGYHADRAGRLLHTYSGSGGTRPNGASSATSFICEGTLPCGDAPHSVKCGLMDWYRHMKVEDRPFVASKPASYCINEQFPQKAALHPYGLIGKRYPFSESANPTATSVFCESSTNQYPSQDTVSLSMLRNNSLSGEDLTLFDTASAVQGLPEISESGRALSLLSSQTQNFSGSYSSGIQTASPPLIIIPDTGSPHPCSPSEMSEDLFGVSSQALNNGVLIKQSYRVASSAERNQMNLMPLGNGNTTTIATDFTDGFLHGSRYVNVKNPMSFKDEPTIDLLQLSTQLHRVEHPRQALPVKQEN